MVMDKNVEVSVVIPAYNSENFIGQALQSVLAQSFSPREIIIIDDGSTDQTKHVIAGYVGNIKYVYQENAGPAAARNRGVLEAKSDWIAFLDSDDYWDADHLEQLVENLKKNKDAVLVYCGKKWIDKDGNTLTDFARQEKFPSGWIFNDLFKANYISTASVVLVKKSIFHAIGGFNEKLWNAEDYDLWLCISAIAQVCGVPVYTVNYRRHATNLTLQTMKALRGDLVVLKKCINMIAKKQVDKRNNPERIDVRNRMKQFYNDAALSLFHLGEYRELRSLGFDVIKHCCITKSFLIRWILCWLPKWVVNKFRDAYSKSLS